MPRLVDTITRMPTLVATSTDSPEATQILAEYFSERTQMRPESAGPYRAPHPAADQFTAPNGRFVIARDGDETLGCAGVRAIAAGPEWVEDGFGGSHWFELKHVFTRPSARGRGVAKILIEGLITASRELGGDRLVLDTHSSLAAAAQLYQKQGFRQIPRFNSNSNADRWYGIEL